MRNILVVEDDDDLRELLMDILEGEGFRVQCAANGLEGLACVDEERPDLILLDMKMPAMDGWEFAARLNERGFDIPIVVVTAALDARERAEQISAQGWVAKPFAPSLLLETIHDNLP